MRFSGSAAGLIGTLKGADSAGPAKATPAAAAAAPPSRSVSIRRRSIAVIGFLPTKIDLNTIALGRKKSREGSHTKRNWGGAAETLSPSRPLRNLDKVLGAPIVRLEAKGVRLRSLTFLHLRSWTLLSTRILAALSGGGRFRACGERACGSGARPGALFHHAAAAFCQKTSRLKL